MLGDLHHRRREVVLLCWKVDWGLNWIELYNDYVLIEPIFSLFLVPAFHLCIIITGGKLQISIVRIDCLVLFWFKAIIKLILLCVRIHADRFALRDRVLEKLRSHLQGLFVYQICTVLHLGIRVACLIIGIISDADKFSVAWVELCYLKGNGWVLWNGQDDECNDEVVICKRDRD